MAWELALLPLAMLALGFPFFLALLATAAVALVFFAPVPPIAAHQVMFASLDKYALLAVPFFIFAGDLLGRGGVSGRLVRFVQAIIGHARGSLPFTSLGAAVVFSAISGSTAATVAAVGGITYKRMRDGGYGEPLSTGLLIAAGALGNLIPPSIGFILYGIASDTSIVQLFAAGIVPGLILALAYGIYIYREAVRRGETGGKPFSRGELWGASRDGLWAIAAPVVVLGGIYAGIFSPTEAAAVACVYAIFVVTIVYRESSPRDVFDSASRSMYLTAQVFIILACAGVYSWLLTITGAGPAMVEAVGALSLPPWALLLAINVLLLVVGMVLDTVSAILVLTPLLAPIAADAGIDPIHFGVIVVMNLSIGTFTPPFGLNLFVGQAVFRAPLSSIYKGVAPFIAVAVVALAVVTYVPEFSLVLTRFL
ncbi:MAG TPA: TRAP transporter large permease [Burkholderiaceae bacterium]|nr:TRAP transporter large permease [Burkholderiaceae bacterium]